jgi:NADPH-dependent glutamate synthase beta subunit-like oxidoreductase
MFPAVNRSRYVAAIVGGAIAGAETAGLLADRGITSVVFEQNARPYGKIEDGLPRWHVKLRQKEYETINQRLDRPDVHFVPLTKIGQDIDFHDLVTEWGFTTVILAHGAWRDRPLPIEGVDDFVGRGLIYQNPLIYWFNHFNEAGYDGPRYDLRDGAIVVGGGLASIDVMKVLQIELVHRTLEERGIREDMLRIEHAGVPTVLSEHGLQWEALGLKPATLYYRRRVEDMPLVETPPEADPERQRKFEATRRKILEKAMQKYAFQVQPLRFPIGFLVDRDRLAGLRFQHTRIEGGRVIPIEGQFEEAPAPLVVSSIGSVPEPMKGIPQRGELYDYKDRVLGRLEGYETVFSTGNVVTGKGNILASRRHSIQATTYVIESFLGLGHDGNRGEAGAPNSLREDARHVASELADWTNGRPGLDETAMNRLIVRVGERQKAVGYDGSYQAWIEKVTPPDLA